MSYVGKYHWHVTTQAYGVLVSADQPSLRLALLVGEAGLRDALVDPLVCLLALLAAAWPTCTDFPLCAVAIGFCTAAALKHFAAFSRRVAPGCTHDRRC